MNLETNISKELWCEIGENYGANRFADAIKDSIFYLSKVIREKSNLEGDGVQLVGDAFGGVNPKIRVSKLQTDNDRNVQRGTEAMLRGLYQAVRNPRSHEKITDQKCDADAIIHFVDYLVRVVIQSQTQFSLSDFIARVFDKGFVPLQVYADHMVNEIPANKKMVVMRAVLARRHTAPQISKLNLFFHSLLQTLSPQEEEEAFQILSNELQMADDLMVLRSAIAILNPADWPKIDLLVRMRVEHKVVESIREGVWDESLKTATAGVLGAWGAKLFPAFTLKKQALEAWMDIFFAGEKSHIQYLNKFVTEHIPYLNEELDELYVDVIISEIDNGDEACINAAYKFRDSGIEKWYAPYKDALRRRLQNQ